MRCTLASICKDYNCQPRWFRLTFRAILDIGPDGSLVRVVDYSDEDGWHEVDIVANDIPWHNDIGIGLMTPHLLWLAINAIEDITARARFSRGHMPEGKKRYWWDPEVSPAAWLVRDPDYRPWTWILQ